MIACVKVLRRQKRYYKMFYLRRVPLFLALFVVLGAQEVDAQRNMNEFEVARTLPPVRISLATSYQSLDVDGQRINELSTPLSARFFLFPDFGVSVGMSQASASGDDLADVDGITDVQLALDYLVRLEDSRVIVSLGANIPSGTNQLSDPEYETSLQLARIQYGFRVPYFGQGSSVTPGLAFISSVSANWVVSVGGAYRLRNPYKPIDGLAEDYEWGNELMVTLGIGGELAPRLSLSLDATYTSYEDDKIGATTVYKAGRQVIAQALVHRSLPNQDIWLTAKYRTANSGDVLTGSAFQTELLKSFPDFFKLIAQYRAKISAPIRVTILGESAWYGEDVALNELSAYGVGVMPEFFLSPAISIPIHSKLIFGDITGYELGIGLVAVL